MKKIIVSILLIACLLSCIFPSAHAIEGYTVHSRQFLPEHIISLLTGDDSVLLLDHDPSFGQVAYVSWVSYDYLSELSTKWRTAGVIVFNRTMNAYFIRVSFVPTVSSSGAYEYCGLGTSNGYILGAKSDGGTLEQILAVLVGGNNGMGGLVREISSISQATWDIANSGIDKITSRLDQIISRLDTLSSIVSDGKVKINDTNILAALTSINNNFQGILDGSLTINGSSFDDADVLSAIDTNTQAVTNAEAALTGGLTRIADAIDYNFGEYSGTHVFPSLNDNQAVVGDKAELFESISGKVFYSSLNRIYIRPRSFVTNFTINVEGNYTCESYTRVDSSSVQHHFLFSGDMRPTTPVEVSVPCYNFLGAHSMEKSKIFPVAWRYDPSANAYVGFTSVSFYFSRNPEGYPVSTDPAAYDHPYVYALDSSPVDVVFSSRFTAFQQLENTRLINALSGLDYSSSLNTIIDKLDALIAKSGDTVVNVIEDDTYIPKVFYLDDDTSAVGTTKDGISLFSDLVRWLWKNVFDGAFGAADITKLDGLFYDPAAAVEEVP